MINDLFVRYTTALDAGDVETIVGCFTEDGALESPAVGVYSGRQGIREFAERFARFRERGSQLRHFISNLAVQVDGDDGAGDVLPAERHHAERQDRTDAAGTLRLPAGEDRRASGCSGTGWWCWTARRSWKGSDRCRHSEAT